MCSWQRFNETSLPDEKEFYSNLAVEKTLQMLTTNMQKESGNISEYKNKVNTMIYMYKVIHYY